MTDIVERLQMERRATAWRRGLDCDFPTAFEQHPLCNEAAAEITRLRAEAEALRKALQGLLQYLHKSDVDGNGWVCSPIHVDELNAAINATKGAT